MRSDRDLTVAGRHSRRFYGYATRWMVSEVALHRAKTRGGASFSRRLKWAVSARIGRLGMTFTQGERTQPNASLLPVIAPADIR